MNYKSGDLVKITGNCTGHWFKIGETVRLKRRVDGLWAAEYLDGHDWWNVRESDMAPAKPAAMPQKIIITTDGKITLAQLFGGKTMVKRAEAKCAPSDTFDFAVGAELAVKRLMGANPVTEPVKGGEPVNLHRVKSYGPCERCAKGKVYETANGDGSRTEKGPGGEFKDAQQLTKAWLGYYLVPLVRRPAKVGEWVLVGRESEPKQARRKCCAWDGCIVLADGRRSKGGGGFEHLVLDGYHGDPA